MLVSIKTGLLETGCATADFFMQFPLGFGDFSYPAETSGQGRDSATLGMPISYDRLRHWLSQGLLSGYAAKISGEWRFALGVVEIAQSRHKELGGRQPPQHPGIPSGYLGLRWWVEEVGMSYGRVYHALADTSGQLCQIALGIMKDKGRWLIPVGLTSDAIVAVIYSRG